MYELSEICLMEMRKDANVKRRKVSELTTERTEKKTGQREFRSTEEGYKDRRKLTSIRDLGIEGEETLEEDDGRDQGAELFPSNRTKGRGGQNVPWVCWILSRHRS